MPTPDVDVTAILDELERHRVEYVVIGGFATELHDVAIPPTRDIDLTPSTDPDNLERLAEAMREIQARFRVFGGPSEGVDIPGGLTADWLAQMVTVKGLADKSMSVWSSSLSSALAPSGRAAQATAPAQSLAGARFFATPLTLTTDAGPVDIVLRPDGTDGYDDLVHGRLLISYEDRTVPVASLEDIIRSKEAAGREKDLLVIPALRAHSRRLQRVSA